MSFTKNNSKLIRAWTFYDWANSVYSLVITSTIFPIYYSIVTYENNINTKITLLGRHYAPDALFSYSLATSFVFVIILSPILSSFADVTGTKKRFLQFFCYLGAFSCIGLFFFTSSSMIVYALTLNVTASIGFWGSLVFYNSYLPDIATEDIQDKVSARGYIMGYSGAISLLVICLILIELIAPVDQKILYTRISFILTGIWWLGFAQYTFAYLPNNINPNKIRIKDVEKRKLIINSFTILKETKNILFRDRNLKYFLFSFFFYSIGVQTIFLMAALFGSQEIKLNSSKLIFAILLTQFIAIVGAFLCSWLAKKIGNKLVLIFCVSVWSIICVAGFFLDKENPNIEYFFYAVAGLVGLVMGGLQSISRSTYSKMLPEEEKYNTATYFSFYDVLEKFAIVIGTSTYGYLIDLTGNMRYSILAMSIAFILGLIFLFKVSSKKINI